MPATARWRCASTGPRSIALAAFRGIGWRQAMLLEMQAHLDRRVRTGDPRTVIGWRIGAEGASTTSARPFRRGGRARAPARARPGSRWIAKPTDTGQAPRRAEQDRHGARTGQHQSRQRMHRPRATARVRRAAVSHRSACCLAGASRRSSARSSLILVCPTRTTNRPSDGCRERLQRLRQRANRLAEIRELPPQLLRERPAAHPLGGPFAHDRLRRLPQVELLGIELPAEASICSSVFCSRMSCGCTSIWKRRTSRTAGAPARTRF